MGLKHVFRFVWSLRGGRLATSGQPSNRGGPLIPGRQGTGLQSALSSVLVAPPGTRGVTKLAACLPAAGPPRCELLSQLPDGVSVVPGWGQASVGKD